MHVVELTNEGDFVLLTLLRGGGGGGELCLDLEPSSILS